MEGYVCIITGANSLTGIGRAAAYSFAKMNAKAIYVTDIKDSDLYTLAEDVKATTGVDCIGMKADASCDEDILAIINAAMDKYGRLDVFFANAGVAGRHPFVSQTKEAYMEMMSVNAWSAFAACKYASIAMQKTSEEKPVSGGAIICNASVGGVRSGGGPMSYSASKAAVINTCQTAAWRLHGKNIRVNSVCPGLIKTEMTDVVFAAIENRPELEKSLMQTIALERYGRPEEVSETVAFLASSAGSYITGQDIKVDGGVSAAMPYSVFFGES
ncbi:hypothetical protein EDC94DRAFT_619854 [Helicostylum pulchrum]|uniref:Uncharacterized protein n=1 Tax=Helicostylum pulchrum TaxID=562976 RepID=A0ABP9XME9_9FUNG|nr:hypothetical protein EDC94DRAFT_619854 [Helicostylum pulchrum]